MNKLLKFIFLITIPFLFLNCTTDDDCPDTITVDINDPASIARAEACGLSPAGPLGNLWVSDSYRYQQMNKH
ncbi:hypothetical protein ACS386_12910 [Flavobacteriaceae bacterium LMO-SS05]